MAGLGAGKGKGKGEGVRGRPEQFIWGRGDDGEGEREDGATRGVCGPSDGQGETATCFDKKHEGGILRLKKSCLCTRDYSARGQRSNDK